MDEREMTDEALLDLATSVGIPTDCNVSDGLLLKYARAAIDAARRTTPDREAWISASERVPMPGTSEVLAWNSEGWCAVVNPEYVSPAFPEYTHWMPLPTAPTSDKGGA